MEKRTKAKPGNQSYKTTSAIGRTFEDEIAELYRIMGYEVARHVPLVANSCEAQYRGVFLIGTNPLKEGICHGL